MLKQASLLSQVHGLWESSLSSLRRNLLTGLGFVLGLFFDFFCIIGENEFIRLEQWDCQSYEVLPPGMSISNLKIKKTHKNLNKQQIYV